MLLRTLFALGAFLGGSAAGIYAAGPPLGSGAVAPLAIETQTLPLDPRDPAATRVGRLRFLGAVALRSPDRRFGGISALLWEPACRRLLAVSDTGNWLILEPREAEDRMMGVGPAWIAPILDEAGRPAATKSAADAEALARVGADTWVFFELDHRGQRYLGLDACRPESLSRPAAEVWRPAAMQAWPGNGGAEAVAGQGGALLILAEEQAGPALGRAWLRGRPGVPLVAGSYANPTGFEPTAMDPLEPGGEGATMLVLHRRFSPVTGVAAVVSEARFEGDPVVLTPVATLAPPLTVDNMEGLAVRPEGDRRFVYLVSDDNFNPVQRTILMKFELLP